MSGDLNPLQAFALRTVMIKEHEEAQKRERRDFEATTLATLLAQHLPKQAADIVLGEDKNKPEGTQAVETPEGEHTEVYVPELGGEDGFTIDELEFMNEMVNDLNIKGYSVEDIPDG